SSVPVSASVARKSRSSPGVSARATQDRMCSKQTRRYGGLTMTAHRSTRIGMAALAFALTAAAAAQATQPGGPPGQAPTEVTGSVAVTNFPNFPANQGVTVSTELDLNVVTSPP